MSIPIEKLEEIIIFLDSNQNEDLSIHLKKIIEHVNRGDFRFQNIVFDKQEKLILIFDE